MCVRGTTTTGASSISQLFPAVIRIRTGVRESKKGGAQMKRRKHIEIVPVWRERIDHRLYVLALLAFVEQLAAETAAAGPTPIPGDDAGSDPKGAASD